jgi:hypothetical protein
MTSWLVVVRTDEGMEVQSCHESREQARMHCHTAWHRVIALDDDARAKLAAEHGLVIDSDGVYAEGGYVSACDILPDVW